MFRPRPSTFTWILVLLAAFVRAAFAAESATPADDLEAGLRKALDTPGWTPVPKAVLAVTYAGLTPDVKPGDPPGPAWYLTASIDGGMRPRAVTDELERAFVTSMETAQAGKTNLIRGGRLLLVDRKKRVWGVAQHMPHLLRCYDGTHWFYRRADGLPS